MPKKTLENAKTQQKKNKTMPPSLVCEHSIVFCFCFWFWVSEGAVPFLRTVLENLEKPRKILPPSLVCRHSLVLFGFLEDLRLSFEKSV